jgi:hypothetical protein
MQSKVLFDRWPQSQERPIRRFGRWDRALAVIASLIETCKLLGGEPHGYRKRGLGSTFRFGG